MISKDVQLPTVCQDLDCKAAYLKHLPLASSSHRADGHHPIPPIRHLTEACTRTLDYSLTAKSGDTTVASTPNIGQSGFLMAAPGGTASIGTASNCLQMMPFTRGKPLSFAGPFGLTAILERYSAACPVASSPLETVLHRPDNLDPVTDKTQPMIAVHDIKKIGAVYDESCLVQNYSMGVEWI
uniref:Amidase domain-containing protein n=1 Tax=Macrostomum lignano TaxID=282301 RepID=A0A1I8FB53_9PLAT